jgi:tetratricopeptide (TPR) repeat protein
MTHDIVARPLLATRPEKWRKHMSHRTTTLLVMVTAALCLAPQVLLCQEGGGSQETAAAVGDTALRDLASWKHAAAKTYLESKQPAHGSSASFKTAWGLMLAEQGKLDEALAQLGAASSASPKDPASEFFRGEIHAWRRSNEQATAAWEKARDRAKAQVETSAEDARARYYLGAALVRLRKYQEARTELTKAEEKGFPKALVRLQKGISFLFERKWQEAVTALDAAIAADANLAHAYYYRGRAWKELDRSDKMFTDLDRFLRLAPDAPEASVARSLMGG